MKILFISTLIHNPGDEIIRLGQEHILRQLYPDVTFKAINKHDPRMLFEGFEQRPKSPHRLISPTLYRLYAATRGRRRLNHLEDADLVVFAGGPFIWRNQNSLFRASADNAEWVPATWNRLFRELRLKPVLNLAAGTSVDSALEQEELVRDKQVMSFVRRAVERSLLTTARDEPTQQIVAAAGLDIPLIPCSSILSSQGAGIKAKEPEYVAVNVIRSAAPSRRGHGANPEKWHAAITAAIPEIEKRNKVLFVSHTSEDDRTAGAWFPDHPRVMSMDPKALLEIYSKAKYGLCNRVHAGGAIASFARPAIVIGGDSRIDLVRQFGLPVADHRDVDAKELIAMVRDVEDNYDGYVKNLRSVISLTEKRYLGAVRAALGLVKAVQGETEAVPSAVTAG